MWWKTQDRLEINKQMCRLVLTEYVDDRERVFSWIITFIWK